MLPDEPLLRPLENPPPDPPRAFAKEIVGTPTRDNTRHAAINLVVFKRYVLSIERLNVKIRLEPEVILTAMPEENLHFLLDARRIASQPASL